MKKAKSHFEVVDHIERVREGANNMANTDKKFLNSLNTVLTELRTDYFKPLQPSRVGNAEQAEATDEEEDQNEKASNRMRDSIDDFQKETNQNMNKTRESGFSRGSSSHHPGQIGSIVGPNRNTHGRGPSGVDLDFDLGPMDVIFNTNLAIDPEEDPAYEHRASSRFR